MTPITLHLAKLHIYTNIGSHRALCPECSHTRVKRHQRCLRVHIIRNTEASVNCKHCGYRDRIRVGEEV